MCVCGSIFILDGKKYLHGRWKYWTERTWMTATCNFSQTFFNPEFFWILFTLQYLSFFPLHPVFRSQKCFKKMCCLFEWTAWAVVDFSIQSSLLNGKHQSVLFLLLFSFQLSRDCLPVWQIQARHAFCYLGRYSVQFYWKISIALSFQTLCKF